MTPQEQALADQKMRAEIAKLIAETSKINKENQWYLAIIASGFTAAMATLLTVVLNAVLT
ncbi:MAG: hypothetical protein AAF141_04390 [Pseudomonadota bacterium]